MALIPLVSVHSDVWRGSAGQDGPVFGQGEALCWLCPSSQAIHVTGLQHQLLPTAGEERLCLQGLFQLVLPGPPARSVQPQVLWQAVLPVLFQFKPIIT